MGGFPASPASLGLCRGAFAPASSRGAGLHSVHARTEGGPAGARLGWRRAGQPLRQPLAAPLVRLSRRGPEAERGVSGRGARSKVKHKKYDQQEDKAGQWP